MVALNTLRDKMTMRVLDKIFYNLPPKYIGEPWYKS